LQDEIMDENDIHRQKKAEDSGYKKYASFRELAHAQLSPQQIVAIISFLSSSLPEFSKKFISDDAFKYLVHNSTILEFDRPPKGDKMIYTRGLPDQFFTLVLQGKLEIRSGSEGFFSDCGPFSYLGLNALKSESFVPDFSAKVVSHVQLLRIKKKTYDTAQQMTLQAQVTGAGLPRKTSTPNRPENRNFTDSTDFIELTSTGINSTNNKDKKGNNLPIKLKSLRSANVTATKGEMVSLMKAGDFVIEDDADDDVYVGPNHLTSAVEEEKERWKKIIGNRSDAIISSDVNQSSGKSNTDV